MIAKVIDIELQKVLHEKIKFAADVHTGDTIEKEKQIYQVVARKMSEKQITLYVNCLTRKLTLIK